MLVLGTRILACLLLIAQGGLALGAGRMICVPLAPGAETAGHHHLFHGDHHHTHGIHHHHAHPESAPPCDGEASGDEDVHGSPGDHLHIIVPEYDGVPHAPTPDGIDLVVRPTRLIPEIRKPTRMSGPARWKWTIDPIPPPDESSGLATIRMLV